MSCYLFVLFSFISGGRIPHPSIVLLFLSIYTYVVSYPKKKKNRDKAPGPDDFSLDFWQDCWEFVKEEIMGF